MESLKKSQTKCQMTLTYFIAKKIIVTHLLLFTIILLCCFLLMTKSVFDMTSHHEMHLGFQKVSEKKLLLLLNYLQHTLHENI